MARALRAVPLAVLCLLLAAYSGCSAPKVIINQASGVEPQLKPVSGRPAPWQLVAQGNFRLADQLLAKRPLDTATATMAAQGMLDIYHGRYDRAEDELRRVLDARADSALRSLAYQGLEAIFLDRERYAALESLELRAARERLEFDSTNRFVAQTLNRIGPPRIEVGKGEVVVPMVISSVGIPVVRASANGGRLTDFWFDTGAGMSVVTEGFARRNHVRIVGEQQGLAGTSTMRKVQFRIGVLDSLSLGTMKVVNLPVMVMPDEALSFKFLFFTMLKIDAIIGWPLISRFRTTLDFRAKQIRFAPSAPGALTLERNLYYLGQPYVELAVNSTGPLNFIFDTGAMVSMITPGGLERLTSPPILSSATGCVGGAGGSDAQKIKTIPDATVTMAGKEIAQLRLTVHTLPTEGMLIPPDGLCGEDILKNFVVTIDPANGVLLLE